MRIDDNKEALAMMNRALGSLEGKIREAYNKGFHDGRNEGMNLAKREIAEKILGEVEDEPKTFTADGILFAEIIEPNSSEKPNNCKTKPQTDVKTMSCYGCKHRPMGADICDDPCHCHYEPQTDCAWK